MVNQTLGQNRKGLVLEGRIIGYCTKLPRDVSKLFCWNLREFEKYDILHWGKQKRFFLQESETNLNYI